MCVCVCVCVCGVWCICILYHTGTRATALSWWNHGNNTHDWQAQLDAASKVGGREGGRVGGWVGGCMCVHSMYIACDLYTITILFAWQLGGIKVNNTGEQNWPRGVAL